jgi:hypothetical protein
LCDVSAHRGRMCRGIVDASSLRLVVPGRIKRELPEQLTCGGRKLYPLGCVLSGTASFILTVTTRRSSRT